MTWLAGIIGAVVGSIVTIIFHHMFFTSGTLRIDRTDPDKEIYRIELGDLNKLSKKRRITLKVDNNADLSQK